MIRLLALLAALTIACVAPSQNDGRYGTVTVGFGPAIDSAGPWRSDQLVELRAELTALNALGPTFTEASEGTAMFVVRPFDSSLRTGPCHGAAGCFTIGNTYIEIDPVRTAGFTELRAAMGHELGHAVGMDHICFAAGELPTCRAAGPAMMNPSLSYGDVFTPDGPNNIATDVPTQLDLDEYRRVHP